MRNAEHHGILHKGQYGSRQGKMGISMVLLKRISYDIIRQTRIDACMFDNNATACYDRIIPSMAMLKCRRAGLPRPAAQVVLQFLQHAQYHVRTAYGISAEAFSNLIDYVLGLIQGTGHAGPGWAMTSSIMRSHSVPMRSHSVPIAFPCVPMCSHSVPMRSHAFP